MNIWLKPNKPFQLNTGIEWYHIKIIYLANFCQFYSWLTKLFQSKGKKNKTKLQTLSFLLFSESNILNQVTM